jgi:hypothetical protein
VKILQTSRWFARLAGTPEFNVMIFSFLLNLAWEVWQVPFFRGMADEPHWLGVKACTQATFGDAGIALGLQRGGATPAGPGDRSAAAAAMAGHPAAGALVHSPTDCPWIS